MCTMLRLPWAHFVLSSPTGVSTAGSMRREILEERINVKKDYADRKAAAAFLISEAASGV